MIDYGLHQIELLKLKLTFFWGSETGDAHKHEGKHNEDAIFYTYSPHYFAMAIADGLGSCSKSAAGAQYAVTAFCHYIDELFANGVINIERSHIWTFVQMWRHQFQSTMKDYDTTLQWIIFTNDYYFVGSIGDGLVCSKGQTFYLFPQAKQPFSNVTVSLTGCTEWSIQLTKRISEPMLLLTATDGIANDIQQEALPQLLQYMDQQIVLDTAAFQQELRSWVKNWETAKHTDDRTIGILHIKGRE